MSRRLPRLSKTCISAQASMLAESRGDDLLDPLAKRLMTKSTSFSAPPVAALGQMGEVISPRGHYGNSATVFAASHAILPAGRA
jgi:hypothetical protein